VVGAHQDITLDSCHRSIRHGLLEFRQTIGCMGPDGFAFWRRRRATPHNDFLLRLTFVDKVYITVIESQLSRVDC